MYALLSNPIFLVVIGTIGFAILAPVVGCLLAGLERKITAKMQGRVGPSILQPYYDVRKLIEKDDVSVNGVDGILHLGGVGHVVNGRHSQDNLVALGQRGARERQRAQYQSHAQHKGCQFLHGEYLP